MNLSMGRAEGKYNGLGTKIRFIKKCYTNSLLDSRVRRMAEQAAGRGTRREQARALFDFIREKLTYTRDPVGVEMTKSPSVMVEQISDRGVSYGDCDDHACLSYAMLNSIGIPAKLRVAWYQKPMPQHIYAIVQLDGVWYPFDTTRASGFESEPPYTKAMEF